MWLWTKEYYEHIMKEMPLDSSHSPGWGQRSLQRTRDSIEGHGQEVDEGQAGKMHNEKRSASTRINIAADERISAVYSH